VGEASKLADQETRKLDALWGHHREGKAGNVADPQLAISQLEAANLKPGDAVRYPDSPYIEDFVSKFVGNYEQGETPP